MYSINSEIVFILHFFIYKIGRVIILSKSDELYD